MIVTAVLDTVEGMYKLSCSFTEELALSVVTYGNVPSIVIVFGEMERLVDIWDRSRVPLFVMVTGIVSV